jgi:hypothetical protein
MKNKVHIDDFKAKLATVSEIDFARLAAYIDGEGSIVIARALPIAKHRQRSISYQLNVSITNSSDRLIVWLHDTFGGSIQNKPKSLKTIVGNKPVWGWHLQEKQADAVLQRCLAYFIIKREQAEIAIDFCKLKTRGGPRFVRVSEESLQQREELRNKIHLLNSPHLAEKVG